MRLYIVHTYFRGWVYFRESTRLCIHFGRLQFKTPVLFYHMSSVEGKRRLSEDVLLADCVNKYLGRLCVTEQ